MFDDCFQDSIQLWSRCSNAFRKDPIGKLKAKKTKEILSPYGRASSNLSPVSERAYPIPCPLIEIWDFMLKNPRIGLTRGPIGTYLYLSEWLVSCIEIGLSIHAKKQICELMLSL